MIQNSKIPGTKCGTGDYSSPELMMLKKEQKYDAKNVVIFAMGSLPSVQMAKLFCI